MAGVRYPPGRVVIVSVDDATLDAHPEVPLAFWSPLFAQVIKTLRGLGARTIALDMLFSVTAEDWMESIGLGGTQPGRGYDRPMKEELARGDVVLGALLAFESDGRETVRLPIRDFYTALPRPRAALVGLTNFLSDQDGAIRCYLPRISSHGHLSLGALLAIRALGQDPLAPPWHFGSRQVPGQSPPLTIEYCGPPGTFPRVSMNRLLAPGAQGDPELARLLAGKVVVVALEPTGSQDMHQTPYSRSLFGFPGHLMSGPEVHASIIESLLAGRFSSPMPLSVRLFLLTGFLLAATLLSQRTNPGHALPLVCLLTILWAALSYLCFTQDLRMPVAGGQAGMASCYLACVATRLTGEEKRRRQLQRIFGRYVSKEIVDQLLASGKMPDLGGELFEITVLFSDIRNFTTLSERMPAHEVVAMLNAYFSQVSRAIMAQGGTVDKYIGDAVMALFGVPARQPDHALRAIRAALAIGDITRDFRQQAKIHTGQDAPDFDVGIGIHTGWAVVGNIGSPERLEYTAVGDTVNIASRLEGLTKALGWSIVASEATVLAAGPTVLCGAKSKQTVKGRSEAVTMCEITGIREEEDAP